jgi:hypothetical protein
MVVVPVACAMAGVQAGLVVGARHAEERDIKWPAILMAAASASLLAAGVLRHYVDVYVYRTVRGISFIFVGIDALGDVFSLLSVVCQPTLDILGIVIYGTELVLWIGIFVCGAHYNLLPWLKEHHTQLEGGLTATVGVRLESATIGSGIALHDLPSSTSVFRTPSAAFEATRRAVTVRASGQDVQGPAR